MCCNLINFVSQVFILALQRGRGVEFRLKLCNVIYKWPLSTPLIANRVYMLKCSIHSLAYCFLQICKLSVLSSFCKASEIAYQKHLYQLQVPPLHTWQATSAIGHMTGVHGPQVIHNPNKRNDRHHSPQHVRQGVPGCCPPTAVSHSQAG